MKKLIVFDLDGTLVNSLDGLNDCMNAALCNNGLKKITAAQTKAFVGDGILNYTARAVFATASDTSEKDYEELIKKVFYDFTSVYVKRGITVSKIYDGMDAVLKTLKARGCYLAILTNKAQNATDGFVSTVLKDYDFDGVIGQDSSHPLKPDAWGLNFLVEKFGLKKEDAVMIGDGQADYLTAKNAGVDHIGVLWGFRSEKQLRECGATTFASRPKQLIELISKSN